MFIRVFYTENNWILYFFYVNNEKYERDYWKNSQITMGLREIDLII